MLNNDPVYYRRISEKLVEILKRFKTNWDEQVKLLKELREEVKKGRKSEEKGLDAILSIQIQVRTASENEGTCERQDGPTFAFFDCPDFPTCSTPSKKVAIDFIHLDEVKINAPGGDLTKGY